MVRVSSRINFDAGSSTRYCGKSIRGFGVFRIVQKRDLLASSQASNDFEEN